MHQATPKRMSRKEVFARVMLSQKGPHPDYVESAEASMHDTINILNHDPMSFLLRIVPAFELDACAWRRELVVEEQHHIISVRPP